MAPLSPMNALRQWRKRLDPASREPLYRQIAALVEADVKAARLAPGATLPPLRTFSDELGVGMITVRKAIKELGDAGLVVSRRGSGTVIADAAGDRNGRGTRPLRIGVVFTEIEDGYPFFRPMMEAFRGSPSAKARPIQLQLLQLDTSVSDADEALHRLPLGECDGLIAMSPVNPILLTLCRQRGLPYVLLFNHFTDGVSRCICPDYHVGMLGAVAALKAGGKRRVALVASEPSRWSSSQVIGAFELAMGQHGLPIDRGLIRTESYDQQAGFRAAQALLRTTRPPDAIVFSSDRQACGGCVAVEERGLKLKTDVAIVACGGALSDKEWPRALATIDLHLAKMGRLAVTMLRALIAGEEPPFFQAVASSFHPGDTA